MTKHERWRDLTSAQQRGFLAAGGVQLALAAIAWIDLARRPQEMVHGRKPLWAAAITVNFVGPIAYLWFGRERDERRAGRAARSSWPVERRAG